MDNYLIGHSRFVTCDVSVRNFEHGLNAMQLDAYITFMQFTHTNSRIPV